MSKKLKIFSEIIAVVSIVCGTQVFVLAAKAQTLIARVDKIQPVSTQGIVYVTLENWPTGDGGGCTNQNFVGQMSDIGFQSFIFPMLLTAKATNKVVKLTVSGCYGVYPSIVSVEMDLP